MTGGPHADPAGHGAGRISGFTVLFDADCPPCRAAPHWLAERDQLTPLTFVPAGSPAARREFASWNPRRAAD